MSKPNVKDCVWVSVLLVGWLHAFMVYEQLPAQIAVHFGIDGQPDRYMALPWGALVVLVIALIVLGLGRILLTHRSVAEVRDYLHNVIVLVAFVLVGINVMLLEFARGAIVEPVRLVWALVGVMLIVVCNPMGKLPINRVAGVRLPSTVNDPEVWARTNRFAGWLGTILGVSMIIAYFLPMQLPIMALIGLILIFVVAVTEYARRISTLQG